MAIDVEPTHPGLQRKVLRELEGEAEMDLESLADATDSDIETLREAMSDLIDRGKVKSTVDWNYAIEDRMGASDDAQM